LDFQGLWRNTCSAYGGGNTAIIPKSVFDSGYPLPALIANNYGEMMSIPMYDSALMFAALLLLTVILLFNVAARLVMVRVERKML
jgi:phosphate transport system permease protein